MVELKIFHDRAKQIKNKLTRDLKTKGSIYEPEEKKYLSPDGQL